MTQGDVTEAMTRLLDGEGTVSQGYVSKAEAARLSVGDDRLQLFAAALGYPTSLLTLDDDVHGVGVGLVHHRKRASLSARTARPPVPLPDDETPRRACRRGRGTL